MDATKYISRPETARLEDFRRTFHPIPFANSHSLVNGTICGVANLFYNYVAQKPLQTGAHRTLGLFCAGYAIGYYMARYSLRRKIGRLKYSLDFMERHKDEFPAKKRLLFSDPSVLDKWRPKR